MRARSTIVALACAGILLAGGNAAVLPLLLDAARDLESAGPCPDPALNEYQTDGCLQVVLFVVAAAAATAVVTILILCVFALILIPRARPRTWEREREPSQLDSLLWGRDQAPGRCLRPRPRSIRRSKLGGG